MPYSPNDSWDQVLVNPGLCSQAFLVFHSSIQFGTDLCPSDLVSWRGHKIAYTRVGRLISLLVKMYAWAHARSLFIGFFVEVLTICKERLALDYEKIAGDTFFLRARAAAAPFEKLHPGCVR